jgi:hypothetical protein
VKESGGEKAVDGQRRERKARANALMYAYIFLVDCESAGNMGSFFFFFFFSFLFFPD